LSSLRNLMLFPIIVMVLSGIAGSYAHSGEKIVCYSLSHAVQLDGKWTTAEEWIDAAEVSTAAVCIRVKHDEARMYVLIDHVADPQIDRSPSINEGDLCWIYADPNHDGGEKLQPDDYGFGARWAAQTLTLMMAKGAGGNWTMMAPISGFEARSSSDQSTNPKTTSPHVSYELSIPKYIIANPTVGARFSVRDGAKGVFRQWPIQSRPIEPDTWADLEFSALPIGEFSMSQLPLIALICLSVTTFFLKIPPRRSSARPGRPMGETS